MQRRERIKVKADQIIVWVSITAGSQGDWEAECPRFPAVLDTGSSFNFSIRETHLRQWAGIDPRFLERLGFLRHLGWRLPRLDAELWLHKNKPGTRDLLSPSTPNRLSSDNGIAIYPDDMPHAPRLPLLGLQTITQHRLHLSVDGERRLVSLRSRDWVTRLTKWLN